MACFYSEKVVLGEDVVKPACVVVEDGKIIRIKEDCSIEEARSEFSQYEIHDYRELVLMPGVVDSHVHVNEPGRTEWEGFHTATHAAAAGGITTIVDMPLNSIPATVSVPAFTEKREAAEGQIHVDVGFWGGVIPGNQDNLVDMLKAGICGFKCFMVPSGVPEFPMVFEEDIRKALETLKGTDSVLMFHAEVDVPGACSCGGADEREYSTFLKSRPDVMEVEAIKIVCKLCKEFNVPCHIVHLSSAEAIPLIQDTKRQGAPLTVETTHHYLSLSAEEVPQGSTVYKSCPPIRDMGNQSKLWEAVRTGIIDLVISDHSPSTPELKALSTGNFIDAWGGIASLQLGLSLLWTHGQQKGLNLFDVVRLLCSNTAKLAGLADRKGSIAVGKDADFVIWDPTKEWTVEVEGLHHKNKISPYIGKRLVGKVHQTVLRGKVIYADGKLTGEPSGQAVLR